MGKIDTTICLKKRKKDYKNLKKNHRKAKKV